MDRGEVTLDEQKRAVRHHEAFLISREERALLKKDAVNFFIGDTNPGNLAVFQKQPVLFSSLLHFVLTFLSLCIV